MKLYITCIGSTKERLVNPSGMGFWKYSDLKDDSISPGWGGGDGEVFHMAVCQHFYLKWIITGYVSQLGLWFSQPLEGTKRKRTCIMGHKHSKRTKCAWRSCLCLPVPAVKVYSVPLALNNQLQNNKRSQLWD